ncbi:MAG: trehalose-6-phosphate synthase, partial [Acidimicrobiales bacterium]
LNLVAKEAAIVNERGAGLILSTESGAWSELADFAYGINPYDVSATAAAIHEALSSDGPKRAERAAGLRIAATSRVPMDWFNDQLAAARRPS